MLKGWECQGCLSFFKIVKKNYYEDTPVCPDKCSECGETVFKRVEEPVAMDGLYEKKDVKIMDDYEDTYDYIKGLSDSINIIKGDI